MKLAIIIPARYNSSRLPGKPLIKINKIPILIRTYLQCAKAISPKVIYVATDHIKIKKESLIKTIKNCILFIFIPNHIFEIVKKYKKLLIKNNIKLMSINDV